MILLWRLAKKEEDAEAFDFRGDFSGGLDASACRHLGEVEAIRKLRDLPEVDRPRDVRRVGRFGVDPVIDDERAAGVAAFVAGEPLAAVEAQRDLRLFRREVAVRVGVPSERDLHVVRGRCECGERQVDVASEAGPVRDRDIDRAFGVGPSAWCGGGELADGGRAVAHLQAAGIGECRTLKKKKTCRKCKSSCRAQKEKARFSCGPSSWF